MLALAAAIPICLFLAITWRRPDRRVALLFALIVTGYALPYLVLDGTPVALDFLLREAPWAHATPSGYVQKNPLINDVPLQMLPWQEAVRTAWTSGSLPLLDRATAAGSVLWLNPQAAVLFPTSLAGLLVSTFAWPLLALVSKLLIALWGTYLLLGHTGLSTPARIFGAIAYAFSTFAIAFALFPHTNVTSLIPLLLASLHGVRDGWRSSAAATGVVILMLLGGHPESVLHAAFVAVPYAAVLARPQRGERLRLIVRYLAIGITAALVTLPLVLPFVHWIPQTERYHELRQQPVGHPTPPPTLENLASVVIPNYFGNPRVNNYRHDFNYNELATQYAGLATFALAIAAAIAAPRRHRFWIAVAAVATVLSFQPPALTALIKEIPLIGLAPHGRARVILTLALAILGAHGFEMLLRGERRKLIGAVAAGVAIIVAAVALASYPTFAEFGVRRLVFFTSVAPLAATALVVFASRATLPRLRTILPLLLLVDLTVVTLWYNPPNDRAMYYPRPAAIAAMRSSGLPERVTGIDRALLPITSRFYGLEDIRAHDPVAWRPYVAVLDAAGWDRSDYFGRFRSLPPRQLLDFLGVRYVITEPQHPRLALPVVHAGPDAVVYRNDTSLPRFFVPSAVAPAADPVRAFLRNDQRGRVFSDSLAMQPAPARIAIERYDVNGSTVRINADAPTFIASSEAALPGWSLTRNGVPWPMEQVNGPFLGWRAPAGESRFALSYRPPWLAASAAGTLAGLLLLTAMLLRGRLHHPERGS